MKIILKSDVEHLGFAGDLLKVKDGFARNYLFPKNLAFPAKASSAKEALHKKKVAETKAKKAQALRNKTAEKIKGHKISFKKEASSNGKLFGSVSVYEISKALKKDGFTVDKKFIELKQPIKMVGEYEAFLSFGDKVQSKINIEVLSKKVPKKEADSSKEKPRGFMGFFKKNEEAEEEKSNKEEKQESKS